jgi:hypothetical protein
MDKRKVPQGYSQAEESACSLTPFGMTIKQREYFLERKKYGRRSRAIRIVAFPKDATNLATGYIKKRPGVALRVPYRRSYANIEALTVWLSRTALGMSSELARLRRPVRW